MTIDVMNIEDDKIIEEINNINDNELIIEEMVYTKKEFAKDLDQDIITEKLHMVFYILIIFMLVVLIKISMAIYVCMARELNLS